MTTPFSGTVCHP